jgi:hypothetical protein
MRIPDRLLKCVAFVDGCRIVVDFKGAGFDIFFFPYFHGGVPGPAANSSVTP